MKNKILKFKKLEVCITNTNTLIRYINILEVKLFQTDETKKIV